MDRNSSSGSDLNSSNDAEGVWSQDIDQAFHEALAIYPPCGRRKIILSDEGKMYGRNELIARYIKLRCGKTRTRKQVSSHIQVLARKKQREAQSKVKGEDIGPEGKDASNSYLPHSSSTSPIQHMTALNTSLASPSMDSTPFDIKPPILGGSGFDSIIGNIKLEPSINSSFPVVTAAPNFSSPVWPYSLCSNTVLQNQLKLSSNGNDENKHIEELIRSTLQGLMMVNSNGQQMGLRSNITNNLISNGLGGLTNIVVASQKIVLCGFVAYIEQNDINPPRRYELFRIPKVFSHDEAFESIKIGDIKSKYPPELTELFELGPPDAFFLCKCWADISFEVQDVQKALYAVDSYFKSLMKFSTKVWVSSTGHTGRQDVEKIEVYLPTIEEEQVNGTTLYNFHLEKSPICEYVVAFINKLKSLGDRDQMNNVLDNFTVLQIVKDNSTGECLMVICFAFEVSLDDESSCRVYRLVK